MNKLTRNNLIATLLLPLIWALMLLAALASAGCAGQGLAIKYIDHDGKLVEIQTDYQVENGFTMERDGDGYKIELGSATTKDTDAGLYSLMTAILAMMAQVYGLPAPAAPATE